MNIYKLPLNQKKYFTPIIVYAFIIFFLGLGDALMAYAAPIYIESIFRNSFYMGLVLSLSSLFGLFLDVLTDKYFPNMTYKKYLKVCLKNK